MHTARAMAATNKSGGSIIGDEQRHAVAAVLIILLDILSHVLSVSSDGHYGVPALAQAPGSGNADALDSRLHGNDKIGAMAVIPVLILPCGT
jgi:hypothetical protein